MVMRVASIQIWTSAINSTSFMFILLAPLWINAFVYMTLGRLVYMYMPDRTLLRIGARRLGMLFVCLDIRYVPVEGHEFPGLKLMITVVFSYNLVAAS